VREARCGRSDALATPLADSSLQPREIFSSTKMTCLRMIVNDMSEVNIDAQLVPTGGASLDRTEDHPVLPGRLDRLAGC
jgi:hypothetical protein